jgi:hypothetical protein
MGASRWIWTESLRLGPPTSTDLLFSTGLRFRLLGFDVGFRLHVCDYYMFT